MAKSFAHQWGQMIGDFLEAAILPCLTDFARKHGLFVDKKGVRPARKGEKVTWVDINGNKHDLDFVLERGGSPDVIGKPVAFIETAWRRYTKHSKNKAQEIQGAIEPLVAAHHKSAPFMGAVLAGEFTSTSVAQLKSVKFAVLHFSYASVVKAFQEIGIDASSDEKSTEETFSAKAEAWTETTVEQRAKVATKLLALNKVGVNEFIAKLEQAASRIIDAVFVLPLHGQSSTLASITEAIQFIEEYTGSGENKPIVHYVVQIRYSNGNQIDGKFVDKETVIEFLPDYEPLPVRPATEKK